MLKYLHLSLNGGLHYKKLGRFALLLIVFICCTLGKLHATHIVGGELNYRCLGGDTYELKLTIYRDCYNGVPFFDNPAAIGIFDVNNVLLNTVYINVQNNDTTEINLSDPCLVVPPNVCYHRTIYTDTVSLPYRSGGYQLAYQRCCRNYTINNIVLPDETGMTCYVYISEAALSTCNSNPVFVNWPEPLICNHVPINFDHSAIDYDGDLIVYEMVTPFNGADVANPMPQPPNAPPYVDVTWAPGFGVTNMLGGSNPLTIDPVTGLLTGTPVSTGQYVVGVWAREYRNGQLLSVTRRDFQYNVGTCGLQNSASFFAPTIQCDNQLQINFANQSQSITNTYLWDFGDPSTTSDVSTLQNPSYVYPDTGCYTVTLIAAPGSLCSDTFSQQVCVQLRSLEADFTFDVVQCQDSLVVVFDNLSTDTISQIVTYSWDFGNSHTSTDFEPTTSYTTPDTYYVSLIVQSQNGCNAFADTTFVFDGAPITNMPPLINLCPPGLVGPHSAILNPGGNGNLQYQWAPATGLSSTTAPSPVATPLVTTTYIVTVTVPNSFAACQRFDTVTVVVSPPMTLSLVQDTTICGTVYNLAATSSAVTLDWFSDAAHTQLLGSGSPLLVVVPSSTSYYLVATDIYGCRAFDQTNITVNPTTVSAAFDFQVAGCRDSLTVDFHDLSTDSNGAPVTSWTWDFGNNQSANTANPTTSYLANGSYPVTLYVSNNLNCTDVAYDTVVVSLPEINFLNDTIKVCVGGSSYLTSNAPATYTYVWTPSTGLDNPTSANPLATPTQSTTYSVSITDAAGCSYQQRVRVEIVPPLPVTLGADTTFCGGVFQIDGLTNGATFYEWSNSATFTPVTVSGPNSNVYYYPALNQSTVLYLRVTDINGCKSVDDLAITLRPAAIIADNIVLSCNPDTVRLVAENLNPTNGILTWTWQPATLILADANTATPLINLNANYSFTAYAENQYGCRDSAVLTATFNPGFGTVTASANRTTIFIGQSEQLTVVPNGINYTYQWQPANLLNDNTVFNPIATPPPGETWLAVTVTDYNGCAATDTLLLKAVTLICDEPYIFIPNAFSPNNDGDNDVLMVRSNILTELHWVVYNRWGQKVFEGNDLQSAWDGHFNGEDLPPDVFGYFIEGRCYNGDEFFKKGNVTLVR